MKILVFVLLCSFFLIVACEIFDENTIQRILKKHNDARRAETASNMKKLIWNGVLARMASEWAEQCRSDHGQPEAADKPYEYIGQNLNVFTRRQNDYVPSIQEWIDEKNFYDFDTMGCEEGKKCGHYRQLVWADSWELGCGYAKCDHVKGVDVNFGDVFVCNYGPSGNIKGEKPYKQGASCAECGEGYINEDNLCVSPAWPTPTYATGVPLTTEEVLDVGDFFHNLEGF